MTVRRLPGHPTQRPLCIMHDAKAIFVILTSNNSPGNTWSLHIETEVLFSVVYSFFSNCWSVVADKTSDGYGSLSVCSVLPRATADEDTQREVQVRANLFARPSISGFLIRIVEKSAAGGRLYGHHYPTSPYSLVLYSLAPQHMAVLLLLPFEVCFKWLSLAEPQAFGCSLRYCVWDEDKHLY